MTSLSAQSNRRSIETPPAEVANRAQRRARWAPAAVLLTALVLRIGLALGVLAFPDRSLTPDGVEYRDFGRSLAAGEGFVRHQTLVDGQPIVFPEVFRTPGYPLFLAAAERLWPGESTVPAVLLQVLIGSGTCLLVYAVTRRLTRRTLPALCAGLYFAVDTPSAVHSALLLSETLAAFLLAAALLFGLRFIERRRLIDVVLAAAAFVLAAHARPVFLSAGVPLLLALFIGWRADSPRFVAALLLVALTMGVGIGGWMLRNARTAGYPVFSAVNDFSLLFHGAGLEAREVQGDPEAIANGYLRELTSGMPPNTKQLDQGRWYRAMRDRGRREIESRLGLLPGYMARNLVQLLTSVDHEDFRQVAGYPPAPAASEAGWMGRLKRSMSGMPGLWLVVSMQLVMTGVLWVGIACAAARAVGNRIVPPIHFRHEIACLLVAAALGLAAGALPNAQARFRLSFLPLLVPLAAVGCFGTGSDERDPENDA